MQGMPLNVAYFILGWILSMLSGDLKTQRLGSIPTTPIEALTEFYHSDARTNVQPLSGLVHYGNIFVFVRIVYLHFTRPICTDLQFQVFLSNTNIFKQIYLTYIYIYIYIYISRTWYKPLILTLVIQLPLFLTYQCHHTTYSCVT